MENHIIYPGESVQVGYWTKRWGITTAQLHEAILETGSLRVKEIKTYLKRKIDRKSFSGMIRFIKLSV